MRVLIVGAGAAGSVIARSLAEKGIFVRVIDKRCHVAGNCYDCYDDHGVLIHKYGPHYFRTDSEELISFLSKFTKWKSANYIVKALVDGKLYPFPINLSTMITLTGNFFNQKIFEEYLKTENQTAHLAHLHLVPENAEEQCVARFGKNIYEKFFKNYTRKQWGVDASLLDPSITARIPLRYNFDERYPVEKYQVLPADNYTKMFSKMLDHPNIEVMLNTDFFIKDQGIFDLVIYTGPIDQYFNYCFGKLEYRSLDFEWKNYCVPYKQPCVQINYPNDFDYTRSVEIKHISGQISDNTSLCYEYPKAKGEAYYPLLTKENIDLLKSYQELAKKFPKTYFVGRLAEFKYYNMDQIMLRALDVARTISFSE